MHMIYYSMLEDISKYINDFRCGSDQFIHTIILNKYSNLYYQISEGYGSNLLVLYNLIKPIIILIGPGHMNIPPTGWGAIESIIWDYYENIIKKNINVIIINTNNIEEIITNCNSIIADVVHIMYDDYICIVPYLKCKKIIYTSHMAYITNINFKDEHFDYYQNIFQNVIKYQDKINLFALSNKNRKHV